MNSRAPFGRANRFCRAADNSDPPPSRRSALQGRSSTLCRSSSGRIRRSAFCVAPLLPFSTPEREAPAAHGRLRSTPAACQHARAGWCAAETAIPVSLRQHCIPGAPAPADGTTSARLTTSQVCALHGLRLTKRKFYSLAGMPIRDIYILLAKEQGARARVRWDLAGRVGDGLSDWSGEPGAALSRIPRRIACRRRAGHRERPGGQEANPRDCAPVGQ